MEGFAAMRSATMPLSNSLQKVQARLLGQHSLPFNTQSFHHPANLPPRNSYSSLSPPRQRQFHLSPHTKTLKATSSGLCRYSSTTRPAMTPIVVSPEPRRYSSTGMAFSIGSPSLRSQHRRYSSTAVRKPDTTDFAFAFDIDGVLLRSSSPLPGATEALAYLHDHNIPFILLTNGGGKHESARVLELSKKLGVPLSEENFVQSHTPFKQLVEGTDTMEGLKDKTILVTGGDGDKCRKVAEMYGFNNVVTPGDILIQYPTIWPFNQIFTDYYKSTVRPLPRPIDPLHPSKSLKFDAVFVFNDPRDWALDSQIILDLLMSKDGVLGTYSDKNGDTSLPNNGWQQDGQPKLFFSNPDLFWATSYHLPRLGQGGFQASLQGIWNATTGGSELTRTVIGKPYYETYNYAERILNNYRSRLLAGNEEYKNKVGPLKRVFMVGDNPESDIRGANSFHSPNGIEWSSILLKTGVYRDGTVPAYKPKVIVNDVFEAVKWALEQEGFEGATMKI